MAGSGDWGGGMAEVGGVNLNIYQWEKNIVYNVYGVWCIERLK